MEQAFGWWDAWGYLVIGAVLAALAFLVARRTEGGESSAVDVAGEMVRAATVARELVAAAEQLYLTGKLPRDERFDYAVDRLGELFPNIEPNQLVALVEAAVYFLRLKQQEAAAGGWLPAAGPEKSTEGVSRRRMEDDPKW
ncbi:MAG TPA: hypothetical protein VNK95_01740 [Caldilineaceae bacterium]|nr:hypothetical protein [Caldilineaceae bacterium]